VKFVLDTNVFSEMMKGNAKVLSRLRSIPKSDVSVPQPVLAEIAYGIERLPKAKRRDRLSERHARISEELPRAPWTDDVTAHFGEIKAALERRGERIEDFDIAIAAHARAANAVLVTANASHMDRVEGLRVEDWTF